MVANDRVHTSSVCTNMCACMYKRKHIVLMCVRACMRNAGQSGTPCVVEVKTQNTHAHRTHHDKHNRHKRLAQVGATKHAHAQCVGVLGNVRCCVLSGEQRALPRAQCATEGTPHKIEQPTNKRGTTGVQANV